MTGMQHSLITKIFGASDPEILKARSGCVMALSCDHRIMVSNDRAIIGLNEAAIGPWRV